MTEEKQLEIAVRIAEEKHAGQVDKQGVAYIYHPMRVMNSLEGGLKIAGVLHDVIEDTDVTPGDLMTAGIDEKYVHIIETLTRQPDETYDEYIEQVKKNPDAVIVKLADLHDNLRDGCPTRLKERYERALVMLRA